MSRRPSGSTSLVCQCSCNGCITNMECYIGTCRLPSFTEEYTQSTPLTRIRDIAHRVSNYFLFLLLFTIAEHGFLTQSPLGLQNDIPHELKQEIKHTIQVAPAGAQATVPVQHLASCIVNECPCRWLHDGARPSAQSLGLVLGGEHRTLLQNKLHRNAGPEDLVATEAMLKRVTTDGSFSQDFVSEFKVFTAELRDFFNAGSFADMLAGVRPALDEQEQQV